MSVRSDLVRGAVNSVNDAVSSAVGAASSYLDYQNTKDRNDQIFKANQFKIRTSFQQGMTEKLQSLPENVDFSTYQQVVEDYKGEWLNNLIDSGVYDQQSISWAQNEFLPSQKAATERAVAEVTDYAQCTWLANDAGNYASMLASRSDLDVEGSYSVYKAYYEDCGLSNVPGEYGILDPEMFREAIRGPKALQNFETAARDPEKGFAIDYGFDKDAAIEQAMKDAGYSLDNEDDKKNFVSQCDEVIAKIDNEYKTAAATAQNQITSEFYMKYRNGEQFTATDVISAAEQAGAITNGQISRYWTSFLGPYIEYEVAQKNIDAAILAASNADDALENLDGETVRDVVNRVNNGTFQFVPSGTSASSGTSSSSSGSSSNTVKVSTGIPIPGAAASSNAGTPTSSATTETTEQETKRKAPENFQVDYAEGLSWKEPQRKTAESEGVTYLEDYEAYDDGGADTLSGRVRSAVEASTPVAEGSMFEGLFGEDGNINYSRLSGKKTFSCDGMPDIDSNYEPVVIALCQEMDIPYDKGSAQVYKVASMVQEMADNGAFTNPDKMKAVQKLSVARLNPEVTVQAYNEMVMQYKATQVLTDDEINTYGLSSSAFAGDLKNTGYSDSLDYAYRVLFKSLFGGIYSTSAVNKLKADKYNQWQSTLNEVEQQLQIAYQMDPTGMNKNGNAKVEEIITKITDDSFAKELYALCTGKPLKDVYSGNPYVNKPTLRMLSETSDGAEILADYFSNGTNKENLNPEMVDFVTGNFFGDADNLETTRKEAKQQIEDLAQQFYEKPYSECSLSEKNTLTFSYFYGRTSNELTKRACARFGYETSEVYGNVIVEPTLGYGGGMAIVTKDGRVFMSGSTPDGSGHNWVIGSVSSQTLDNISHGITTLSYGEISANGVYPFSDSNTVFDRAGRSMTDTSKKGRDKEYELVGIYEQIQPDRYNMKSF